MGNDKGPGNRPLGYLRCFVPRACAERGNSGRAALPHACRSAAVKRSVGFGLTSERGDLVLSIPGKPSRTGSNQASSETREPGG